MDTFRALVAEKSGDDFSLGVKRLALTDLPAGGVTIRAVYSSVNFKDGLASSPNGNIVSTYPFIPGIDVAGTVVSSDDARFAEGDEVLVTGYDMGVSHYGGFSEYVRVPAEWVVRLPHGLNMKEAMAYGTAGFTAALSVQRLEESGVKPENGPVLVTGATGGVGSLAVAILAKKGYEVAASTGKQSEHEYLTKLGATRILTREEVSPEKIKPLGKTEWAGAVDPVGGRTLAYLLTTTKYGGSVAVSGLTGGTKVDTTVYPFILRGVNLLGIDSVYCPMDVRVKLWQRMADDLKPTDLLEGITRDVTLDGLGQTLADILQGKMRGRAIVAL
ncbi:NADPH:quinone oxidoreductase family protein [Aneurinibacillus tyrosinisolvens]|uniref:NADPH:quinone oxidoreductase family protein n=1 Tax=Aneurinibacillus tyrosinisolvens TaxID=1443435 RepID=UPI00063FCE84|nr:acryloyl-CoA reductase [Aneurinibacillus tyrosinisolvens]